MKSLYEPTTQGVIHTLHQWSNALQTFVGRNALTTSVTSVAWGTANKAFYVPITVLEKITIAKFYCTNGGTASGNFDIGLYDNANSKISSTGSTAQSGTNTVQSVSVAQFTIYPGVYKLAMSMSSTTGTQFMLNGLANASSTVQFDMAEEASALPLPSTATPVTMTTLFAVPLFGMFGAHTIY